MSYKLRSKKHLCLVEFSVKAASIGGYAEDDDNIDKRIRGVITNARIIGLDTSRRVRNCFAACGGLAFSDGSYLLWTQQKGTSASCERYNVSFIASLPAVMLVRYRTAFP